MFGQGYLGRLRENAIKAAQQLISSVKSSSYVGDDSVEKEGGGKQSIPLDQQLVILFHEACEIMDVIAVSDNIDPHESERRLQTSGVKNKLKSVALMLREELDVNPMDSVAQHPCLDVFLQSHFLHALCNRGVRDMPRGSMPLVLTSISHLLKVVKYDTFYDYGGSLASRKSDGSYFRRVDISLTSLLSILWLKISENPSLLEYFYLRESRESVAKLQFYVLEALFPLAFKDKMGEYVRKNIIVAVSMHDTRIASYLCRRSSFVEGLVSELSRRFLIAIDLIIKSSRHDPDGVARASSSSAGGAASLGLGSGTEADQSQSVDHVLDNFIIVVNFLESFMDSAIVDDAPLEADIFNRTMCLLRDEFLSTHFRSALLTNSESSVLAVNRVVASLFDALSIRKETSLLGLVGRFIVEDCRDELPGLLLSRCGSVSKPVASSTVQLMTSMLQAFLFDQCMNLLALTVGNNVMDQSSVDTEEMDKVDELVNTFSSDRTFMSSFAVTAEIALMLRIECSNGLDISDYRRGGLVQMAYRKLESILNVSFEEQRASVDFIKAIACLIGGNMVLQKSGRGRSPEVAALASIVYCVEKLWNTILSHLLAIPPHEAKISIVEKVLFSTRLNEANRSKVLEKEPPRARKFIEAGAIVRVLRISVVSCLIAAKNLSSYDLELSRLPANASAVALSDDFEYNEDIREVEEAKNSTLADTSQLDFVMMQEFESLETSLNEILSFN